MTTRQLRAEVERLQAEVERLRELLRGVGANRYWEGRWRDADAEIERLRAARSADSKRMLAMSDKYETLDDEVERLQAEVKRLQSDTDMLWKSVADKNTEILRLRAEAKQWQTLASQGIEIERELRGSAPQQPSTGVSRSS